MDHSYNSDESSQSYQEFLASTDGHIFREVLGKAFLQHIAPFVITHTAPQVLDAGCGDGWLAGIIQKEYPTSTVRACDAGVPLIETAKSRYPAVDFSVCDLNNSLPYKESYFDIVTASMVLHDVENEKATLENICTVLKPGGVLVASIVNPYYGYPIGEWKRGLWRRIFSKKPRLKLARSYNQAMRQNRPSFNWRPKLASHFTPLSSHIRAAAKAGLMLTDLVDLESASDSPSYNLTYQLHRFPIILLLKFQKIR